MNWMKGWNSFAELLKISCVLGLCMQLKLQVYIFMKCINITIVFFYFGVHMESSRCFQISSLVNVCSRPLLHHSKNHIGTSSVMDRNVLFICWEDIPMTKFYILLIFTSMFSLGGPCVYVVFLK